MSNLKSALKKIGEVAADFASLEVETYTGDLKGLVESGTKWDDFKKLLNTEGKVAPDSSFRLALYTHLALDGDAKLFRDENGTPPELVAAHEAAVKAGIETRASILALFSDFVGIGDGDDSAS